MMTKQQLERARSTFTALHNAIVDGRVTLDKSLASTNNEITGYSLIRKLMHDARKFEPISDSEYEAFITYFVDGRLNGWIKGLLF